MTKALEAADALEALHSEIPFYTSEQLGNPHLACAAMMLGATVDRAPWLDDPQAVSAFSGAAAGDVRISTGLRTLQSFSDHGIGTTVISQFDYTGFAERGAAALPEDVAGEYSRLSEKQLVSERFSAGLYMDKLQGIDAHERRAATAQDIINLRNAGWLVKLEINMQTLMGGEGYRQLPLVVVDAEEEKLTVHNPGVTGFRDAADKVFRHEDLHDAWEASGFTLHAIGRVRQVGSTYYKPAS